ncbi:MAG TPA: type VI secretion system-associated protein TagF [Aquabacterium sp.]|nr:type VI secretion system-associated protein TagF [Aquabacterium sp.]
MSTPPWNLDLMHFGKLPCRGDFVRSTPHAPLLENLDHWQTQFLERLSVDPRWKLVYDAAAPMQFAILGNKSSVGLAGTWRPSRDASGRRFPFLLVAAFDLPDSHTFIAMSPVALRQVWSSLAQSSANAFEAEDMTAAQAGLAGRVNFSEPRGAARAALIDFLETHTVASLEQMLNVSGNRLSVRQAILALGLLLQPVMAQGPARLTKVLSLPIVADPSVRFLVSAFWLSMIVGFFRRSEVEFGVFLPERIEHPQLLLSFQGASVNAMCASVDTTAVPEGAVSLSDAEWVEAEVAADYGLRKLSNYLKDPSMSLVQVLRTYEEVFLGM